jgi:membrane fusion protein, heavy metal efflux system
VTRSACHLPLLAALALLAGCGSPQEAGAEAAAAAKQQQSSATAPGVVVLPPDSPQLAQIKVAAIGTAPVPQDEVTAPGKIEVNPSRVSRVVLPLPGRIVSVNVKVGDAIKQGQPLLTVESADTDAATSGYMQARAALTQARANLVKAQADYDRAKDLFDHDAVARKEVINAENALAQAKAGEEQAAAADQQSRRRLELYGLKPGQFGQRLTVAAPISGKVLDVSVAPGEFRNDTNAPLVTIADLSTVWFASDVPESAIRFIDPGEHEDIELAAYPGQVFRARVTRISDTVDPATRTIKVRAEMVNPGGKLRPEMYGSARHVDAVIVRPVVPASAVIQSDGRNFVFLETGPGRFRQTAVRLGNKIGGSAAGGSAASFGVLEGLKPGDRVVTDGAMLLKTT